MAAAKHRRRLTTPAAVNSKHRGGGVVRRTDRSGLVGPVSGLPVLAPGVGVRATETVGDPARIPVVIGPSRTTPRGRVGTRVGVPSLSSLTVRFARAPPVSARPQPAKR